MHPEPIRNEDDVFDMNCIRRRHLAAHMSDDRHPGADLDTPLLRELVVCSGIGSLHTQSTGCQSPPPRPHLIHSRVVPCFK